MNWIPVLALPMVVSAMPGEPLSCQVAPRRIEVGSFYNGARLTIDGMAAAGSKVIVTINGANREERFTRKARFGPIWINSDRLWISGAPSLFLRFSAEPVAAMADRDTIARLSLDEASLRAGIHVEPASRDSRDDARIRSDYIALKRSEGSYRFGDAGVVMRHSEDRVAFAVNLDWPRKAPTGEYQVRVFEVRDGSVIRQASAPFSVVRTGFPAWLAQLAETRASLYGLAAVAISALAGFGIDFLTTHIFAGKRSAAH